MDKGRAAMGELRDLASKLQEAMTNPEILQGISLKPLSVSQKLLAQLPDDGAQEPSMKELRASLGEEVPKTASIALALAASLQASLGPDSLDSLTSWGDCQFAHNGMTFEPLPETTELRWLQSGRLAMAKAY